MNINPLGPPGEFEEILKGGARPMTIYPEPDCETLKAISAAALKVAPEQITFTNGAIELIYLVLQVLRPRTVLIPGPTFREYEIACRIWKARVKHFRLSPKKGFVPDLRRLTTAARGSELVFLCNPNNPTGNLIPPEVLRPFLKYCDREGIFVVVDESFLFFHHRWEELTCMYETGRRQNLMVVQSLTKFYAIPGLRIGCGLAHPQTMAFFSDFLPPWRVNGIAQAMGAAAYRLPDYARRTRLFVSAEREWLTAALSEIPGMSVYPSAAPYLLLKLAAPATAGTVADMLARTGILVRNCSNFAFFGDDHLRVAVKDREKNRLLRSSFSAALGEWHKA